MHRITAFGGVLTAVSLAGYVLALEVATPARAFTVTGAMVGLALVGVGVARDD